RIVRAAALVLAAVAGIAAAGPLFSDWLFRPTLQFDARYWGAVLSLPLGIGFLLCAGRAEYRARCAKSSTLAALCLLAAAQFGWQASGTYAWSRWLDAWREVLENHRGLVAWPDAQRALVPLLPATAADPTDKWAEFGWTFPSLS